MSFFGGSSSSSKPPKLKQVSDPTAENLVFNQSVLGYNLADSSFQTGFTAPLAPAATSMLNQLSTQSTGPISTEAQGALATAGLGDETAKIDSGNEFKTAQELGQPILSKEQRDRNYASSILSTPYFAPRSFTLSPSDVAQIAAGNSGNVNAFNQALGQINSNQAVTNTLQNAQDIQALSSLVSGFAKAGANYYQSPYANPFAFVYGDGQSSYFGPNADIYGFGSGPSTG
jgi:hypothetical protein